MSTHIGLVSISSNLWVWRATGKFEEVLEELLTMSCGLVKKVHDLSDIYRNNKPRRGARERK